MNRTMFPVVPGLTGRLRNLHILASLALLLALLLAGRAIAQVITVDTKSGKVTNAPDQTSSIDRRYAQIEPTHVALSDTELDAKTRLELIRELQSEHGFAMRPFPHGRKGLVLEANGKLEPAGEAYLSVAVAQGIAAKAGDRVILTNVKIEHNRIVFDLNDGPDGRHGFMRHVQIGGTGDMTPLSAENSDEPTGARLTLTFKGHIPELTGTQVKALLAPLISFGVKTPLEAFTDTLPDKLKEAILNHQVLVGMSTEMLVYAMGQPEAKYHELQGNMPFDEWVYGKTPNDVEFVRINGNVVIRVEIAKVGKTPVVFTKDEVAALMRTDGSPLIPPASSKVHVVQEGDADRGAAAPPPSLATQGEDIPNQRDTMKPVIFPGKEPDLQPGANPDSVPDDQPPANSHPAPNAQPPGTRYAPEMDSPRSAS